MITRWCDQGRKREVSDQMAAAIFLAAERLRTEGKPVGSRTVGAIADCSEQCVRAACRQCAELRALIPPLSHGPDSNGLSDEAELSARIAAVNAAVRDRGRYLTPGELNRLLPV